MRGYPVTLTNLSRRRCIVIGGGAVAERKVAGLLDAEAAIELVSPTITPQLAAWAVGGQLTHHARPYRNGDLAGAWLAIAATNQAAVNAAVVAEAQAAGALLNVADNPDAGDFTTTAVIRRGDITLAVSTGGASPALAALIRRQLDATIGPEYAELGSWLRQVREQHGPALQPQARIDLYRALATEEVLAWLRAGDHDRVVSYTANLLHTLERIVP